MSKSILTQNDFSLYSVNDVQLKPLLEAVQDPRPKSSAKTPVVMAPDTYNLGAPNPNAGPGNDLVLGSTTSDTLFGLGGNDTIYSSLGNDLLWGGADNDTIFAGGDNDQASGDAGNDTVHGEAGNDTLFGDIGTDTLFGGTRK